MGLFKKIRKSVKSVAKSVKAVSPIAKAVQKVIKPMDKISSKVLNGPIGKVAEKVPVYGKFVTVAKTGLKVKSAVGDVANEVYKATKSTKKTSSSAPVAHDNTPKGTTLRETPSRVTSSPVTSVPRTTSVNRPSAVNRSVSVAGSASASAGVSGARKKTGLEVWEDYVEPFRDK